MRFSTRERRKGAGTISRRVAGQLVPRLPFPSPLIAPDRAIDLAHLKKVGPIVEDLPA
jgi:hypothetical protein